MKAMIFIQHMERNQRMNPKLTFGCDIINLRVHDEGAIMTRICHNK